MTFDEVDQLVGGLPPSSRRWAAWWANDPTHVQARAWLEVGRRVDTVDLRAGWVAFSDGDR
jgi:hypothetical protein